VRVFVESPSGTAYSVVLRDDGMHEDGEAADGDYGGLFAKTTEAGFYRFVFHAEGLQAGRPYVREAHRGKTIHDPRKPPTDNPRSDDDCCRKLIALLQKRVPVLKATKG